MVTLVFFLVLGLSAWTVSTLMSKGKHQEEIKKEIEGMKRRQNRLEKYIHNLTSLLYAKNTTSRHGNIIQTTDL